LINKILNKLLKYTTDKKAHALFNLSLIKYKDKIMCNNQKQ